jgi:SAM-dependent methyltransferase
VTTAPRNWEAEPLAGGRRLVKDPTHGFYRVTPRPSDQELAAFYADQYRSPCVPHDADGRVAIVTELKPLPGRVLDIGCGSGEFLEAFVKRGWRAVGVEPGAEYAAKARARGIHVVQALLTEPVARELGSFDVVVLAHVLEHLPQPEHIVRLIRDLLRPGGIFYCEVPNDFNPFQLAAQEAQDLAPWWIALPDHLNYFSIESLASFLGAEGFDIALKTTDFPVEMFLLWGDVYVGNPAAGKAMHQRRCQFEENLRRTGRDRLLRAFYQQLAAINVGREAIVCARKPAR